MLAAAQRGPWGVEGFVHRNTCVLYLRLATHSFVLMGEEEDETLTFEVFISCHVKHSTQMESDQTDKLTLHVTIGTCRFILVYLRVSLSVCLHCA